MIMEKGDSITISPKRPFFSRSIATSFNLNYLHIIAGMTSVCNRYVKKRVQKRELIR